MEKSFPTREVESQKKPSNALAYALDMVSALGESGLTAVPIKPTTEMLTAGSRAGDVSVEAVWRIYQAMIAAAE